jgi:hypothetical protein
MDIRKIFREMSKKLYSDFVMSSQVSHSVSKGNIRENALREFLENGRLPKRYGVGRGEIVSTKSDVSKQGDLIIYDQLNSIPLLYDASTQIYPVDCVYGVIEVKSQLSKTKLIEGLENIKSVKSIVPNDYVIKSEMSIVRSYKRPKPFGFIFAYSLDGNSLDSLTNNLLEWEQSNPPEVWPNLIIIVGEGLIYHTEKSFDRIIYSEDLNQNCKPQNLPYKHDSFFHFYSYLLDICNRTELPKVEISDYLDLPQQMGKYSVGHNDRIVFSDKDGKTDTTKVYRLNESTVDKIVTWCKEKGKLTQGELFIQQFGQIPKGLKESELKQMVYFYNPEDLPGLHQVTNPITKVQNGRASTTEKMSIPGNYITIDQEVYYYPTAYFTQDDYEVIKGKTYNDL